MPRPMIGCKDERSGIVNARYRLQRKEAYNMPNILGNHSCGTAKGEDGKERIDDSRRTC